MSLPKGKICLSSRPGIIPPARQTGHALPMKDLTQGPIRGHLIAMALPTTIGMLVQTLYFMVDLYFVSGLGKDAIAGVSAAGNIMLVVIALTQMLSVGTVALIAHAVGEKNQPRAVLAFNQSLLVALGCMVLTMAAGLLGASAYMRMVGATAGIVQAGTTYLAWYLPGLGLQFAAASIASALRGTGIVKPTMVVQLVSVVLNTALAPVLIAGWGTHHPMGVAGAGLATTLATFAGVLLMLGYFVRLEHYVRLDLHALRPDPAVLRRLLQIGVPAGGEYFLMFLLNAAIFTIIRDFGENAQAGFGVGSRVLQAIIMPAMAIAFAVPAVAGQNYGARRGNRVRETLKQALILETVVMAALVLVCQLWATIPVRWFTDDPQAVAVAGDYLRVISWNLLAAGVVFGCSGIFQALGNTWPALASSATRLVTFVLPAIALSHRPGFALLDVWHLSVVTTIVQALVSLALVRWQMGKRLSASAAPAVAAAA
jgi:putative MATE family efflux protein